MKDFIMYISTHWYVGLIIAVLIVITVIMWIKALAASQRHREEREKIIAQLEKEKALRNEFRNISESTFDIEDNEKLLYGIAANIQMYLEKQKDMNEAFENLPVEKKYVYALNYVFEDSKDGLLSDFFKMNGQPLTGCANQAVKEVIGDKLSSIFNNVYNMTDDDSLVSFDENIINKYDNEYKNMIDSEKDNIFNKVSNYIRNNKTIFIDF